MTRRWSPARSPPGTAGWSTSWSRRSGPWSPASPAGRWSWPSRPPASPTRTTTADAEGPLLTPPDPAAWGPAQRRLGADEVGRNWHQWRQQTAEVRFTDSGSGPGHPGIAHALAEAADYLTTPPPAGRVRSGPAGEDARTVRADGPGWSLVARTDDIAFLLLDDEPGEVLPVGRGKELPGLLEGLDRLARDQG